MLQLYHNEEAFDHNLVCSTRFFKDGNTKLQPKILAPEHLKETKIFESNFIESLCTQENLQNLLINNNLSISKFIVDKSSVFIDPSFSLVECFSKLEKRDYQAYINIFNTVQIYLKNKEGKRFLHEIILNPFFWQSDLNKITYHWSTLLFSCIQENIENLGVFRHVLCIFSILFTDLDSDSIHNIINFIGRIAIKRMKKEDLLLLCSLLNESKEEKEKGKWLMYLIRGIGKKIRESKYTIPFPLFGHFLTDDDPKLFAETICAISSVYGPKFHGLIPKLKAKFDQMTHKVEIFNSCLSLLKTEPNIVTLLFTFDVCHEKANDITKIMETHKIQYGKGWFKEITELASQTNEQLMNHLIMLLAQLCASNNNRTHRLDDLKHILFIFFSKHSQKTNDEIDPMQTFAANYLANEPAIDDKKELYKWCVFSSFFKIVSEKGFSSFFANDQMNNLYKESFNESEELFTPHSSVLSQGLKTQIVFNVSIDWTKNISSNDIDRHYLEQSKFKTIEIIWDEIKKYAENDQEQKNLQIIFNHAINPFEFKNGKPDINDFAKYSIAVQNTHLELEKIKDDEEEMFRKLRHNIETELQQPFLSDMEKSYLDASQYFENYRQQFSVNQE